MLLVSSQQAREIDARSIERFGVPGIALMESAGAAAARALLARWPRAALEGVCVLAGRGNNGGDGFVVARHLAGRVRVRVLLVGARAGDLRGDAATMARAWIASGGALDETHATAAARARVGRTVARAVESSGIVVDGLLGTGLREAPRGEIAAAIEALGRDPGRRRRVLALDVPSGLDASTGEVPGACVRADVTVTFGVAKTGLFVYPGARYAGRVEVAPLGWAVKAIEAVAPQDEVADGAQLVAAWPTLDAEAHKGSRGRVLVIAGSDARPGAAALAAYAAFRAGAGLVHVATTEKAAAAVVANVPEAMPERLPSHAGEIADASYDALATIARRCDAIVFGPGIGTSAGPRALLDRLLSETGPPLVVDADGLTLLAVGRRRTGAVRRPLVLTPHPGEMGRLLGIATAEVQARRLWAAREAAARHRAVTVLKGPRTLVVDPGGRLSVNPTGNPGLATAGSGDVLAGTIGFLLGRGLDPFLAARVAVWAHGRAADRARSELGPAGYLAREVADRIPRVVLPFARPPS